MSIQQCLSLPAHFPRMGKEGWRRQLKFPPTLAHLPMLRPPSATTLTFLLLTLFNLKGWGRQKGQKSLFLQYPLISHEAENIVQKPPNWTPWICTSLRSILNTTAGVILWNMSDHITSWLKGPYFPQSKKKKKPTSSQWSIYGLTFHSLSDLISNYYPSSLHSNLLIIFLKTCQPCSHPRVSAPAVSLTSSWQIPGGSHHYLLQIFAQIPWQGHLPWIVQLFLRVPTMCLLSLSMLHHLVTYPIELPCISLLTNHIYCFHSPLEFLKEKQKNFRWNSEFLQFSSHFFIPNNKYQHIVLCKYLLNEERGV